MTPDEVQVGVLAVILFLRFGPNVILWAYFLPIRLRRSKARQAAHREKIAADEVEARVAELRRRLGK